jgi:Family of unknown function (DUF5678)
MLLVNSLDRFRWFCYGERVEEATDGEPMSTLELEPEIQAELQLADELAQYPGEWVAVSEHAVVAHAPTLQELREEVGEKEVEGVFQVPEGDPAACFF